MAKPLTIIMVARDQFEQTEKSIRSLVEHTDPADYDLIFFDQSTGPEAGGFVPTYCRDNGVNHKYIYCKENWGYVKAVNHCYPLVETEFSLTCHNDVVFSKYWLRNMMRKFDDANVAAVGPVITFALGQQSVHYAYQTLGCKVKFLLGLFFLARQSCINRVKDELNGGEFWLNPVYGLGDKEELEFCHQIRSLGYKLAIARDVLIEHKGEGAFVDTLGSQQAFYDYQSEKLKLLRSRLGDEVVDDIYKIEFEKQPCVLIGVVTRTNYTHCYFTFSLLGVWGSTPVAKKIVHHPRGHVERSREAIVETALADDDITHVCFIDDDMTFEPDTLQKLLMLDVDYCSGVAFQRAKPYMICIFVADHENKHIVPLEAIHIGTVPVTATGGYFLLVKKEVFKKVPKPWFKWGDTSLGYNDKKPDGTIGEGIGEDVHFGLKANLHGFKGYVDSDTIIKHIGYEELVDENTYFAFKEKTGGTFKVSDEDTKIKF